MTDPAQRAHARGLWEAFVKSRDGALRSELIEHYMPLARIVAARLYGVRSERGANFDDYLQYARVGLIEAVDRFDSERGVAFESYSSHRIRGAILNGVAQQSEVAAQRDFWRNRMSERVDSMTAQSGGNPRSASFADLIEITVGIALGLVLDAGEGGPIDETPGGNPYAAAELEQFSRRVRAVVENLPERERAVVKGHYFDQLEFQEIAQRFSITKGRVSQLHARALARLRELLDERPRLNRRI